VRVHTASYLPRLRKRRVNPLATLCDFFFYPVFKIAPCIFPKPKRVVEPLMNVHMTPESNDPQRLVVSENAPPLLSSRRLPRESGSRSETEGSSAEPKRVYRPD